MTLCYVMFTFLCTFSACYAMRAVMSQINEYGEDDEISGVARICCEEGQSWKFHSRWTSGPGAAAAQ